jgi:phosphoserine phosphatase
MHISITLVCNPAAPCLTAALASKAVEAVASEGLRWLSDGIACDFLAADGDPKTLEGLIRARLGGAPVDVIAQKAEGRRKKLFVADMDSTIIEQECIDELADFAGKRAEISAITERAMRGELDFEGALLERVAMLKGLPETVLAETFEKHITLTPGARTLVRTMKKLGGKCALVSGGFTYFTQRVAAAAGFDFDEANELIVENGVLSGDVQRPIRGREAKENALLRLVGDLGLSLDETMAAGDGANDLAMLSRAGIGVAFHAKPAVAASADARIDHGDLTALLYLQGIPRTEFSA